MRKNLCLGKVHCCCEYLDREKLNQLMSLGKNNLVKLAEQNLIKCELVLWEGKKVLELVSDEHIPRALYELGVRSIPICYDRNNFSVAIGYAPRKLRNVPLLEPLEYEEYVQQLEMS